MSLESFQDGNYDGIEKRIEEIPDKIRVKGKCRVEGPHVRDFFTAEVVLDSRANRWDKRHFLRKTAKDEYPFAVREVFVDSIIEEEPADEGESTMSHADERDVYITLDQDGNEVVREKVWSELPNGEEFVVPEAEALTRDRVRERIEDAAAIALENAKQEFDENEPILAPDLHHHAAIQAELVDLDYNRGHFHSFAYIIYCENIPKNIPELVDFYVIESLNEPIEDLASLCILDDVLGHAEKLAEKSTREYLSYPEYWDSEFYEPPRVIETTSEDIPEDVEDWF